MKQWSYFILTQLARILLLLLCVSIAAFALATLSPVDPLQANVGQAALGSMSADQIQKLQAHWGVSTPPVQRYLSWAGDFIRGDMGESLLYRRSVSSVVWEKLTASAGLLLVSWLLTGFLGIALGIVAGTFRGRWPDRIIHCWALVTASAPAFWLALLLMMIFAVWLGWLPVGLSVPLGLEANTVTLSQRLYHAVLPAAALVLTGIPGVTLHTREKMIALWESDPILFAQARGYTTWHIIRRHGLRGVLPPAITLQFASVGELIGSSVLVEQVFSYPGLGQAAVAAGIGGDIPLLLGITVISAIIVFSGNLTANLLYTALDPRLRKHWSLKEAGS